MRLYLLVQRITIQFVQICLLKTVESIVKDVYFQNVPKHWQYKPLDASSRKNIAKGVTGEGESIRRCMETMIIRGIVAGKMEIEEEAARRRGTISRLLVPTSSLSLSLHQPVRFEEILQLPSKLLYPDCRSVAGGGCTLVRRGNIEADLSSLTAELLSLRLYPVADPVSRVKFPLTRRSKQKQVRNVTCVTVVKSRLRS